MKNTKPFSWNARFDLLLAPMRLAANEAANETRGMIGAVNVAIAADGAGNTLGEEIAISDRFFQVSPFGEFPNVAGLQVFDRQAADDIVAAFNSVSERIGRNFKGLPIYLGHPDHAPDEYPDKRRYGSIQALEVRDNGLFAKAKWNALGKEAVNEEHYVYQSPYWQMREIPRTGGQKAYRPALLESVGLTNNPNIPGLPVGANSKATDAENTLNAMTKEALIKKFNLQPLEGATEVTDAQIEAAVDKNLTDLANLGTERTALVTKLGVKPKDGTTVVTDGDIVDYVSGLRGEVTTATAARDGAVVEAAVNEGRITVAEKSGWLTRLGVNFDAASAELKKLTAAVNTRRNDAHTADLGRRGNGEAASVSDQFTAAVNERMDKHKEDYTTAFTTCKKTHKGLYDQMHQPKGL